MTCSIQGCEHQAAFLLDCEGGGAFLVCVAHQPKLELHRIAADAKSFGVHVPPGGMVAFGGIKRN